MSERQPPYPGLDDISEVPSSTTAWNVYGRGVESVGRGGLPEEVPVGEPDPNQLLVRVDAVGLCFSDVKLIRQGGDHPKLYGRDLGRETARPEPWACVEAAYSQRRRLRPAQGGRTWVIGRSDDARRYRFGEVLAPAREVVLSGLSDDTLAGARAAARGARIVVADEVSVAGPFDDIVMLGPRSHVLVARAADALDFRGVLNLVADEPLDGPVDIDVGRLHYHYTAYVGTTGLDIAAAYGEARNRTELRAGGVALFIGAAG